MPDDAQARAAASERLFHLRQAFKLALSMALFYALALWMNWDVPQYGGLAIVIISLGTAGASIETGAMRVIGTTVGVVIGFLILGLFSHDRWATMVVFAAYMTTIAYFMQASRYPYAWYAAGFIPVVVWADNYPYFGSAFYFGTFRYLNTAVGVMIYTMVDLVFWPRRAGDQLEPLGRGLSAKLIEQFRNYRKQLEQGFRPHSATELRSSLAGSLAQTLTILQQAYSDTPAVSAQRRVWEAWRVNARAANDAVELWGEFVDDCRELDLPKLLPELGSALDLLDRRLERIATLWKSRGDATQAAADDDSSLAQSIALDLDSIRTADLSHLQRAAVLSFVDQLRRLDEASANLLQTMRILAGLEPAGDLQVSARAKDAFEPSSWDSRRLFRALFPAAAFVAGFLFWIWMYPPPSGPKVPMFAGILSLVILRTPMNPMALLVAMVLSVFLAVAPVYWLIMPALSTGLELLTLLFIYSFVFGFLGGRSPALKTAPMLMFVTTAGINNQQSYSFPGVVDGALMIVLAGTILTVVYFCFASLHPEQEMLRSLRRYFRGCARFVGSLTSSAQSDHRQLGRVRKRCFESMILPSLAAVQQAGKTLDYKLYPANDADTVNRLHDSLQSIAYRLEALDLAFERINQQTAVLSEPIVAINNQLKDELRRSFESWACLEPSHDFVDQGGRIQQLAGRLESELNVVSTGSGASDTQDLADLYTMLGCVRGLVTAMSDAQSVISQINWQQWATPRF